jgi:hypothetical protein
MKLLWYTGKTGIMSRLNGGDEHLNHPVYSGINHPGERTVYGSLAVRDRLVLGVVGWL